MPAVVHVLYAEDNPLDADLTRSHFARVAPDFQLEIVTNGADFLRLARLRQHALLLVDHRLPDLEGLGVLMQLAEEGIETPTVLVTGSGDGELAAQALRLGADDYVPKRTGYLEILPARLRELLKRDQHQPALARRSRLRRRRVLLVDDNAPAASSLQQQLTAGAPHLQVTTAVTADAGLDQLVAAGDFDLVACQHRPPVLDSFELIRNARLVGCRTPFIILSDGGNETDSVAAFRLGASDYLLNPEQHYAELALRIDLAVDRHELMLANERAGSELAERQRMLGALRESEKQLNLALDAGRIGLWSWQVGSGHTQFSSRWKSQIGYADHEIRNESAEWESRCHPGDLAHLKTMTARYLAGPWPDFSVEYRMRHKDGSWRWFLLHADLENDEAGNPIRMLGSQIDITALKQQQAEIASTSSRLRQLSRRLLEVQEIERRHLARELHDEIGQVLTVAKIHLQSAALTPGAASVAAQIQEPVVLLDRLLAQVRSLSLDLRPPLLDDLGLVAALHWLLQQHQDRASTPRVHLSADPSLGRLDPTLETACFRIAQEALTNALRHASAKNINLSVALSNGKLYLGVRDDGAGFDATSARNRAERGGSLGLLGMHERALLAGGSLTLTSAPARGTELEAIFPLSNPPETH